MTSSLQGRPYHRLALLCVAWAVVWAVPAAAATLSPPPLGEVNLVKARHEGLRFHWQAVVNEPGGVFVLRRRDARAHPELVRPASPRQRAYNAWWPVGSGIYELRYRTARGTETLLAAMLVNCLSLQDGCAAPDPPQRRPAVSVPALPEIFRAPLAWRWREPVTHVTAWVREPLLPPPRAAARV